MCFVNELELYLPLKVYIMVSLVLVLYAEQQLHCLFGELFTSGYFYSEGRLIVFQRAWKVFRKCCPLCYKQVIATIPRRIKDKFHLYFQSFHEFPSSLRDSGNFVKTLKIRVKIYPLLLFGLMRLHIQNRTLNICISREPITRMRIELCTIHSMID